MRVPGLGLLGMGCLAVVLGMILRRRLSILDRLNFPVAVMGGLVFSLVISGLRSRGILLLQFDTGVRHLLLVAFFTSVGLTARLQVLRAGGPMLLMLLGLSSIVAVFQNLIGVGIASHFGLHPLMGLIVGSVTLT